MDWHRLFGLALTDFFLDSPFTVEIDMDLSAKKQLLDIVIVRKTAGDFALPLPDGFENLSDHNLITFKSHHQPLDEWAIKELLGHYVNYRKQISPSLHDLLPESSFRLYAVCARFPQNLARVVELVRVQPGVYDCRWGADVIRIIVTSRVRKRDENAILHLFSGQQERVQFGSAHYRQHSPDTSTLIQTLLTHYQREGLAMSYTMADFKRDLAKELLEELTPDELFEEVPPEELLKRLPPEELLKRLPPEELLKRLPPEELLKRLPPEERLKGLPPEERLKGLPPEERLKGLTAEQIRAYLKKLEGGENPAADETQE